MWRVQWAPPGPSGPAGPPGPAGSGGSSSIEGSENYVMKFLKSTLGGNSQIWDDGNNIGIGTTAPKQRLEVNGSIQIHEQNSSVAGLMITQSSGETGRTRWSGGAHWTRHILRVLACHSRSFCWTL